MPLPPYYLEIVLGGGVACAHAMMMLLLMKSSCGWMKACLIQYMFCSRENTTYLINFNGVTVKSLSEKLWTLLRDACSRLSKVYKNITFIIEPINLIFANTILYMYIALILKL